MKNKLLLLLSSIFLLAGCADSLAYTPSHGGKYIEIDDESEEEGGGGDHGGGGEHEEEEEDKLMCTYKIYYSYSYTTKYDPSVKKDVEAPILTFEAEMLSPYGACPEAINSEEKVTALAQNVFGDNFKKDTTFPKFLGFSFYSVCLDESGLWNWETDYRQLAVVPLYGIWVSE